MSGKWSLIVLQIRRRADVITLAITCFVLRIKTKMMAPCLWSSPVLSPEPFHSTYSCTSDHLCTVSAKNYRGEGVVKAFCMTSLQTQRLFLFCSACTIYSLRQTNPLRTHFELVCAKNYLKFQGFNRREHLEAFKRHTNPPRSNRSWMSRIHSKSWCL